jgi:predicted AAA+ superfamily ATPase
MGNFIPARLKKGSILTYNQEGTRTFEGETLEVVPVWKWLLGALAEKQDEEKG